MEGGEIHSRSLDDYWNRLSPQEMSAKLQDTGTRELRSMQNSGIGHEEERLFYTSRGSAYHARSM